MNARNINFVSAHNKRSSYPNADSKIKAKEIAIAAGIPVPELYNVVSSVAQFRHTVGSLDELDDFVIKPEHGSGGEGVMVLSRDEEGTLVDSTAEPVGREQLRQHIANIVYGLYSLGGQMDQALIEYRVVFDPVFEAVSYRGVPDVRVIVFQGVPALAMMRLPTKTSEGRANLHQGAVGVGIDLKAGTTRGGVQGSSTISVHPDTGNPIEDIEIPYWEDMLRMSCNACDLFDLGYIGIDIVLDKHLGPLMLEVNVRPGLAVQLANRIGLRKRLDCISQHIQELSSFEDKMEFISEYY